MTVRNARSKLVHSRRFAAVIAAGILACGPAAAHPHILATVRAEIQPVDAGASVIRFTWSYDPGFTAFTMAESKILSFDAKTLATLASSQSAALGEFGFFTKMVVNGQRLESTAFDPVMTLNPDGALALSFSLKLPHRDGALKDVDLEIFDPNFFAYFSLEGSAPVRVDKAYGDCAIEAKGPGRIDLKQTRTVPKAFWAALDGSVTEGQLFVNTINIQCR